jgi:hypothetical protein
LDNKNKDTRALENGSKKGGRYWASNHHPYSYMLYHSYYYYWESYIVFYR